MARPVSKNNRVRIEFTTTQQLAGQLDALVTAGLFGNSRAEVAERLMSERIRLLIKEGFVDKDPVKI
jgi:hypothetical protein